LHFITTSINNRRYLQPFNDRKSQ